MTTPNNSSSKWNSKRIVALAGVILLVLMYVLTLVAAIFDRTASGSLFRASLIASFCIPFLIWIYVWLYGQLTHKKTFTDLDYNINVPTLDTTPETVSTGAAEESIKDETEITENADAEISNTEN